MRVCGCMVVCVCVRVCANVCVCVCVFARVWIHAGVWVGFTPHPLPAHISAQNGEAVSNISPSWCSFISGYTQLNFWIVALEV